MIGVMIGVTLGRRWGDQKRASFDLKVRATAVEISVEMPIAERGLL
jgi:hypothetical protein